MLRQQTHSFRTLTTVLGLAAAASFTLSSSTEAQSSPKKKIRAKSHVVIMSDDGTKREWHSDDAEEFSWVMKDGSHEADVRFVKIDRMVSKGGYLGVDMLNLTDALRDHFGVPRGVGVLVSEVDPESPAGQVGLRAGDVISAIDGESLSHSGALRSAIRSREDGQMIDLELWRDGKMQTSTLALGSRPLPIVEMGAQGLEIEGLHGLDLDGDLVNDLVIHLDEGLSEFRESMDSDEWRARVKVLGGVDWLEIGERMRAAEKRLEELEVQLEVEPEP